jgi:hypothetical protein
MSRVSAAVLAIACLVIGYTLAGARVGASADDVQVARRLPFGVNTGDRVTLTFAVNSLGNSLSLIECTVADVSGGWVQCAQDDGVMVSGQPYTPPPGAISTHERKTVWYDLMRVVKVTKAEK